MSSFAQQWQFAKSVYDTLKGTEHEAAARAYLEATARLVLISAAARRDAMHTG